MLDRNNAAMVMIENAERETPLCTCGSPTTPIARDGQIWLECSTLSEARDENALGRIVRFLTEPEHVRELVIEDELAA